MHHMLIMTVLDTKSPANVSSDMPILYAAMAAARRPVAIRQQMSILSRTER